MYARLLLRTAATVSAGVSGSGASDGDAPWTPEVASSRYGSTLTTASPAAVAALAAVPTTAMTVSHSSAPVRRSWFRVAAAFTEALATRPMCLLHLTSPRKEAHGSCSKRFCERRSHPEPG